MSNDIDAKLRSMFAEGTEDLRDEAFTLHSAKLIARQRNLQRLGAAAMVVLIGIVATALAPLLGEATQFIGRGSLALSGANESFAVMSMAWVAAAAATFYALVLAKP